MTFYRSGAIFDAYRVIGKHVLKLADDVTYDPGWKNVGQDVKPTDLQTNYTLTVPEETELQVRSEGETCNTPSYPGSNLVTIRPSRLSFQ